ncbi:hypothetical protein LR48_Vigan03g082200 [Vigna angularis]|uniref:Uncharacterized protein n=1 Tax=Phaseolus angularis TaxID=3914 RepID=A0A0L9U3U0_PHAAN|nr:hypothetical protein LR48_Vigan03g082200 [Vigna angularis]
MALSGKYRSAVSAALQIDAQLHFPLNGDYGIQNAAQRSEEGERWNQKRHQKVQKEKPQLPLNGSLPLSGTQEGTLDPLRGKMAAEGKNRARALTVERHYFWAWA